MDWAPSELKLLQARMRASAAIRHLREAVTGHGRERNGGLRATGWKSGRSLRSTHRQLSTQVGHSPAQHSLSGADIQCQRVPAETRPSRSFMRLQRKLQSGRHSADFAGQLYTQTRFSSRVTAFRLLGFESLPLRQRNDDALTSWNRRER